MHPVKTTRLRIPDVLLIELDRHLDERGWFAELWKTGAGSAAGLPEKFVQDNLASSKRGVLRGLHFQQPHAQGKLVVPIDGEIFDVAVDLRPASPTRGQWVGQLLTTGQTLFVPEGFAHGYQVVSESAYVLYKCTNVYHPECEHTLAWNDPDLAIQWPLPSPIVSDKDAQARSLAELLKT